MNRRLDVTSSWIVSVGRLGRGLTARYTLRRRPEQTLVLYEFEACPFCRRVREYVSELDLDVMIRPCPKGGGYRAEVERLGGKQQFPFLVDPNTGRSMYESTDIIRYLADTYGDGRVPVSLGVPGIAGSGALSQLRGGARARKARQPAQPLVLYSFEASPYCRIARERLCELGLAYHLINVAKKSAQRAAFVEKSGQMRVPYLIDPNTGVQMFESAEIVAYLDRTYAT